MSDENDEKWEMPEPVFRTTSGALPKRFEDTISHSFAPNAETIEIEEDDDILSIMDTPFIDQAAKQGADLDDEPITLIPNTTAGAEQAQPVVVTAKRPFEEAATNSDGSQSNLLFFVLIGLLAVAVIAAWFFYRP